MTTRDRQLRRLVRKTSHIPSRIDQAPVALGRFLRALVSDPIETLRYVPDAVSHQLFDGQIAYDVEEEWGPAFHRMLGAPWPCNELERFPSGVGRHRNHLSAQGLSYGRGTYGGYSDADAGLGAATWCAVRHLRPEKVLETGVARGVTSRVILEAMSINGTGHLWSIDLPHPFRPELHKETAAAVSTACRDRWTYVRGSSRRRPAALVSSRNGIDMFVHDSLHTGRNIRFELRTVWPALQRGDLALVDDVDNQAFRDFVREVGDPSRSCCVRQTDLACSALYERTAWQTTVAILRAPLRRQASTSEALQAHESGEMPPDIGTDCWIPPATVHGRLNDRRPDHPRNPTVGGVWRLRASMRR